MVETKLEPQRIFGSPLDVVIKDTTHQSLPLVVQHTVEYLEEFGKFMISLGCDHLLAFRWKFSTQRSVFAFGQVMACTLGININGNGVHSMSLMKCGSGVWTSLLLQRLSIDSSEFVR